MEAWQCRIKKANFKNLVSLINEFYEKWIARQRRTLVSDFSNPRNDDYILSTNNKNNKNYAFSYAFNFEIISRNKNLKSNYGEKFAYTLEIKKEGNSTYAILSYGDKVKAELTVGANKNKDAKGYKFILSPSGNVIRFKYKSNTSYKSKYVSYDKYAIFE